MRFVSRRMTTKKQQKEGDCIWMEVEERKRDVRWGGIKASFM
jgi:hypothetical protein